MPSGPSLPGRPEREAGPQDRPAGPSRRRWAAVAWAAGGIAVFALFLRLALTTVATSDGANNALQAWDMLHGHLLLHGWIIGDATYYTFELPVLAIVEIFFAVHTITLHVAMALAYLIVAVCAVAIAVTDSHGASRVARAAVAVAVLAAPTLVPSDRQTPLGIPQHTGSSVFVLASALLIDRAPARRFTAPLLCVILCAGQIGDQTVRYVAVPAVALVCAYRVLARQKILSGDAANLLAAIASVPLSDAVRTLMRHFGGYQMVSPLGRVKVAPVREWPHNTVVAWSDLRAVFGQITAPAGHSAGIGTVFGAACLVVAAAGALRVLWRWPAARRAEQVLLVAIAANIGAYVISTLASPGTPYEIAGVLPCCAALGARAIVPARIAGRATALAASGVAAVAALLPMSWAAAQPPPTVPSWTLLAPWLQAHGLRYGLGGYWSGSAVTMQSGMRVQVRTVGLVGVPNGVEVTPYAWETNTLWFNPSRYYANFVIFDLSDKADLPANGDQIFGKPAETYRIANWEILVFKKNLLKLVKPPKLAPVS